MDKKIKKARRAFFHYGSIGAFQGNLSPLFSRSMPDTCVMPVLMYIWLRELVAGTCIGGEGGVVSSRWKKRYNRNMYVCL